MHIRHESESDIQDDNIPGNDDDAACQIGNEAKEKELLYDRIWLGDTGASAHMTMTLKETYDVKSYNGIVTVGNGNKERRFATLYGRVRSMFYFCNCSV